MDSKIRRYIITKILTSATTGILVTLILLAFGLQLAVVFGILAFFLNFIPSLGSVIATLLPLPVALIQYESLWPVIGVVAIPGARSVAQLEANAAAADLRAPGMAIWRAGSAYPGT